MQTGLTEGKEKGGSGFDQRVLLISWKNYRLCISSEKYARPMRSRTYIMNNLIRVELGTLR